MRLIDAIAVGADKNQSSAAKAQDQKLAMGEFYGLLPNLGEIAYSQSA
jgi:hypothetical protein